MRALPRGGSSYICPLVTLNPVVLGLLTGLFFRNVRDYEVKGKVAYGQESEADAKDRDAYLPGLC